MVVLGSHVSLDRVAACLESWATVTRTDTLVLDALNVALNFLHMMLVYKDSRPDNVEESTVEFFERTHKTHAKIPCAKFLDPDCTKDIILRMFGKNPSVSHILASSS